MANDPIEFRPLTEEEIKQFCQPGGWRPELVDIRDVHSPRQRRGVPGDTRGAEGGGDGGLTEGRRKADEGFLNPVKTADAITIGFNAIYALRRAVCVLLNAPIGGRAIFGYDEASLVTTTGDTDGPPPNICIMPPDKAGVPVEANAKLWVAPTGADIIINIFIHDAITGNKISIFSGSNKLTIPAGDAGGRIKLFASGARIRRYDCLSIDIEQVGSGTAGGYLEVVVEFEFKKLIVRRAA